LHHPTRERREDMELEKNKAIARRYNQIWSKGDLSIIDELASPEITVYFPAMPQVIKGIAALKEYFRRFPSLFGDGDIKVEEEIAEGDKVVLRWSFSCIHLGAFGISATGKRLKWTGISIYRIVGGKIVDERGEEDYYGAFRDLGLLPKPSTNK
jgi:predicted ester cyclase